MQNSGGINDEVQLVAVGRDRVRKAPQAGRIRDIGLQGIQAVITGIEQPGGGVGVAVNKTSGERTYMKMGTGGVGLGLGGQKYQVVFFFETEKAFTSFVEKGWKADASAQAAAGTEGANATTGFVNGIAVWQITDKGLMASVDITGTKYWKSKKLNP